MSTTQQEFTAAADAQQRFFAEHLRPFLDITENENRAFTPEERQKLEQAERAYDLLVLQSRAAEDKLLTETRALEWFEKGEGSHTAEQSEWRNADTGERAALNAGESIRSHPVVERMLARGEGILNNPEAHYGSLASTARALAVGGGGQAVIPTIWASQLIDLARAESVVAASGATIVPMEAGNVKIARQTGDPTAAFRAEASVITPSDPTFDTIDLQAKTMSCIVKASIEFWQDAPNADAIVLNAIARAMAQKIDAVALYGGITTGAGGTNLPTPPNPRGVLATLLAVRAGNVLGTAVVDGTTPTVAAGMYNEILDATYMVKDANETPSSILWSTKLERQYARAVDSTGQPLRVPDALTAVPRRAVNSIPSYTKGTNTTATDMFVGDWSQLLIGQRLNITFQPLDQVWAAEGQYGILATWRGDVALARPAAFVAHRALKGAA